MLASSFMLKKQRINSGCMVYLVCMQTSPFIPTGTLFNIKTFCVSINSILYTSLDWRTKGRCHNREQEHFYKTVS